MKVAARQTLRPSTRPITSNNNIQVNDRNKLSSNRRINTKTSLSIKSQNEVSWNSRSISSLMHDSTLISLRKECLNQNQDINFDFSTIDTITLENFQRHMREYKQSCALANKYEEAQASLRISKLVFKEIQRRNFSNYYSISFNKNSSNKRSQVSSSNKKMPFSPSQLSNQNCNLDQNQDLVQSYSEETSNNNIRNINSNISDINPTLEESSLFNISDDESYETINQFNQKTEEKRSFLIKSHELQLQSFEKIWSTEMPKKYRKPSARLLEIKEKERALAITRDYEKAEELHKLADELILQETNDAQNKLAADYKTARKQLLAKFEKEIDNFEEKRRDKLQIIMSRNQEKKDAEEKREQVIATQKLSNQKLFEELFDTDFESMNENQCIPMDEEPKQPRPTTASILVMASNIGKIDNFDNRSYSRTSVNSPTSNRRKSCKNSPGTPSNDFINRSKSTPKNRLNTPLRPKSASKKSPSKKVTKININFDSSSSSIESESEVKEDNQNLDQNQPIEKANEKNQIVEQNDPIIEQNDPIIEQNDTIIEQNDTIIEQNDLILEEPKIETKEEPLAIKNNTDNNNNLITTKEETKTINNIDYNQYYFNCSPTTTNNIKQTSIPTKIESKAQPQFPFKVEDSKSSKNPPKEDEKKKKKKKKGNGQKGNCLLI